MNTRQFKVKAVTPSFWDVAFARRVGSFEKEAINVTKRFVDDVTCRRSPSSSPT
jgi:hypothetical protein